MTIPSNVTRNSYTGTGITGPYPVTFKFFEDADLKVTVADTDGVETVKTLTTDYTVTGAGEQAGGSITFTTAVTNGYSIVIEPKADLTQDTDIKNEGGNLRESIEDRFDRLCRDDQVQQNLIDRAVKAQITDISDVDPVLPPREAGALIGWNDSGTGFANRAASLFSSDAAITSTGSTTARWISDRFADTVSVLDYGVSNVDGAGASGGDQTAAILAAIGTGNRTVYFPPGTYQIGYIGKSPTDNVNILVSNVNLEFAAGAVLKVYGPGPAITIARAPATTVSNIGIYGANIQCSQDAATLAVPTTGIRLCSDLGNVIRGLTIDDCKIDGFTQYGIVGGGELSDVRITNFRITNIGVGNNAWGCNGLIILPKVAAGVSKRLFVSNGYVQQITNPASPETDASKLQLFDNVYINNVHFDGGGSLTVTGACIVFDQNTNLIATNIRCTCTNGAGLIVQSLAGSRTEISNVVIDGNIGGQNAVMLGGVGGSEISLRHIHTSGQLAAGAGTYDRIEISDCIFDAGIDTSVAAAITNSIIKNNTVRSGSIYIKGNGNIVRNNISLSNLYYSIRVAGNSNFIDANYSLTPANGHVQIISGSGNLIGTLHGDTYILDAGSGTKRAIASVPSVGGIGTYTPGTTTPDVTGINYMQIANSGAVTITNFTGGVVGQVLVLKFNDSNTTVNRSNAVLAGGANFVSTADDTLVLVKGPSYWHEISRAANS